MFRISAIPLRGSCGPAAFDVYGFLVVSLMMLLEFPCSMGCSRILYNHEFKKKILLLRSCCVEMYTVLRDELPLVQEGALWVNNLTPTSSHSAPTLLFVAVVLHRPSLVMSRRVGVEDDVFIALHLHVVYQAYRVGLEGVSDAGSTFP